MKKKEVKRAGGIGFGALTGGLIGALMGPGGALVGALGGGSIGGLIGTGLEIDVEDPRLDEFASMMRDDSSALILVADEPTAADFTSALKPFEGEIIETNLDEQDIKEIRKALKS